MWGMDCVRRLILRGLLAAAVFVFPGYTASAQQTFNRIQFVIVTGTDDLRGDSEATATLQAANGATLQVFTLKGQNQPGWGNNTTHTVSLILNPALPASSIGHIVITLISHNSMFETNDNWNVQSVMVTLSHNGAGQTALVRGMGNPLARLTGSQPSLTLTPQHSGPPASGPTGTFNQIEFVIGTGDDDLRGDSEATATIEGTNGAALQVVTLKSQNQPGWGNNTTHTVSFGLNAPRAPAAIRDVVIRLTSHNSFPETNDNWNVQSVVITLSNNGAGRTQLMSSAGAPLARLTGSAPTVVIRPQPTAPPGEFHQIQFVINTGGDDLRGDSEATATLLSPNGSQLQVLELKNQNQPGWGNNTAHTVSLGLNPARTACAIGHVAIKLISHNSFGESNDNWNVQSVVVTLSNNGTAPVQLINQSGNPLARLTGGLPSLELDGLGCMANAIGPQPGTGRLKGFVDLHTHPLSNLGFGGKLLYGGVDVGSLLPADPDCKHNARATSMQEALGHDNSTHGGPGVNLNPFGGGSLGVQNPCGDLIRSQIIHQVQTGNGAADEPDDASGAPNFPNWPVWNDITHQKMWVDWIRRSYDGGLRVLVALGTNNKTLGDATAGPGDFPTDDKSSADMQLDEIKAFVGRHADFMEVALTSADLERIIRGNKLAIVLGVEVDNIGNLHKVSPLTNAEISAEIQRLFDKGVRYIFPVHLLDNPFGGTAVYVDLFNYSNFREAGHWWDLGCSDPSINYKFTAEGFDLFATAAKIAKFDVDFAFRNPPTYPACSTGQVNRRTLTAQGEFAVKEMMRHGMLIDIDHMSELTQSATIGLAQGVSNGRVSGYPLNSGHSGLRGFLPVAPGTFNQIQFVITTGDDDLRGDSSATATLQRPDGSTLQVMTLKAQNQSGWDNNSTHTVGFPLNPALSAASIGRLVITLTSHNSGLETDDNWNIQTLHVTLLNNGAGNTTLVNATGSPLARLTGSQPSLVLPGASERSMNAALYSEIGKLHGMAGVGSANLDAYQWVAMYQKVVAAMGGNVSAGFGTDTDGLATGMPKRVGSAVHYDDSFPRSSLGTKQWDYNTDGVAHFGMLPDFLKDARTTQGGVDVVDNNVMFGADYFLQTWKKCEALEAGVH